MQFMSETENVVNACLFLEDKLLSLFKCQGAPQQLIDLSLSDLCSLQWKTKLDQGVLCQAITGHAI